MILLAHNIELRPTLEQEEFLLQSCGVRRFVWNQCLAHWNWAYRIGLKPDKEYILFFYSCLKEKFPWIKDVSARASRNAVDDLVDAFKRFFKGVSKHPRFKKRGVRDSFALRESQKFTVKGKLLRLEKLKTLIPMRTPVRFDGQHRQVTVSTRAGKWFASILVKLQANPFLRKAPSESQVGIDLGVKEMAVLSDGTIFPASQPLKKQLKKLAKLQRQLARKVEGSNRYNRLKRRISKLHYRVFCQRQAISHEFTDFVTQNFKVIKIEDLNVSGMTKNHKLARAILDVGFNEIKRQLEYKSELRGCTLELIDRFFPSSKRCSRCGEKKDDLTLSDRIYECPHCGLSIDRDLNAAINIREYSPDRIRSD